MSQQQSPIHTVPSDGAPAGWAEPQASADERPPGSERSQAMVVWALIGAMLIAAALAAVGALNRDVYGAGAFVGSYLERLEEKDAVGALALPGVALDTSELEEAKLPAGSSNALLRKAALPELTGITEVEDIDQGGGLHSVTYSFESNGTRGESTFWVQEAGTRFPFIPTWTFEVSPIAVVNLAVEHSTSFSANGFELDTRSISAQTRAFNNIVNVQVFTPGTYVFESANEFVGSEPEEVLVDVPARVHEAVVTALPTATFVDAAQTAVNAQLDACTQQTVLQPTGCPFGIVIDDRILGDPVWSIEEYPDVTVQAGPESWVIPPTPGDAHLEVDVRSLFDGSITHYDEDVRYSMIGNVYLLSDGTVEVTLDEDPNR